MKTAIVLSTLLALPALAQNTCYTGPAGTTICSTASGVIHGNTNNVGNSVYRDDRGNLLEFQTDVRGNARVETADGDSVSWSQSILGEKKYPQPTTRPHPAVAGEPLPLETWLKTPVGKVPGR